MPAPSQLVEWMRRIEDKQDATHSAVVDNDKEMGRRVGAIETDVAFIKGKSVGGSKASNSVIAWVSLIILFMTMLIGGFALWAKVDQVSKLPEPIETAQ